MSTAKRRWPRWLLAGWAVAIVVVIGIGSGSHLLTLPKPAAADPRLTSAMRPAPGDERWGVLHVLGATCRCSQEIARHLAARGAIAGVRERVVIVGDDDAFAEALARSGFEVSLVSESDLLHDIGVEAVPLLVVAAPGGALRYIGGYTERKQGEYIADTRILAALRGGSAVPPLPLFGCATSARLRRAVDPLGVR